MDSVSLSALAAFVWALVAAVSAALAGIQLSRARALRSHVSRLACLEAEVSELQLLLKRMDARDRMRAIRASSPDPESQSSQTPTETQPNPFTDPAEWKRYMRARAPTVGIPNHRRDP